MVTNWFMFTVSVLYLGAIATELWAGRWAHAGIYFGYAIAGFALCTI